MNIYKNVTTAALTFLGCTSAYKFVQPLVPIKTIKGGQYEDMLVGLIYSKIDYVEQPTGLKREILDAELYCMAEDGQHYMAEIGLIDKNKHSSLFARQNEIISNLDVGSNIFLGRNEDLIVSACFGIEPSFDTIFDVINVQRTFDTFNTIQSYDLNKMSGDRIHHRPGYIDEFFEKDGIRYSLHQIPILSDGKKVLGSQFCDLNHAVVDADTKEMLTVMFGYGQSIDFFNRFSKQLISLKKDLEEHAATTTSMQIISGYPAVYHFDCTPNPTIICQVGH